MSLQDEALDALDGLGRDRFLPVALLQCAPRLRDLLGEPVLALLEELADIGDLLGELGGDGGVVLGGLAAGRGDLVGERGLALLEGLASLGELRLECGPAVSKASRISASWVSASRAEPRVSSRSRRISSSAERSSSLSWRSCSTSLRPGPRRR